jgi:hypothetical protein
VPVIFVRVAFRDGYPEVSPRNKRFSTISSREGMTRDDASTQIHPLIAPSCESVHSREVTLKLCCERNRWRPLC